MNNVKTLLDLYLEYESQYDQLMQTVSSLKLQKKYGNGGESIHRGYHCPSPIYDIIIGNVSRGRELLHPPKSSHLDYVYYYQDDKLIIAEKYDCFSDSTKKLYSREFLLHFNSMVIAPAYFVLGGFENRDLESLSICEYRSDGKILNYTYLTRLRVSPEGTKPEDFEIRSESYFYDVDQLLSNAQVLVECLGYHREENYSFTHDQDGKLMTFQSVSQVNGSGKSISPVYQIPTKKRRIV